MANYQLSHTGAEVDKAIGIALSGSPVNLLDNSDFANPVNQRGYTNDTIVENAHFIDRWSASGASSFSFGTNGIEIKSGFCHQIVSISKIKSGHVYTLACKMGENILCYNGVAEETIGAWEEGFVTICYAGQGVTVYLTKPGATYEWVALYEGAYTADTLPPYVPKGYAVELAECQRYYLPIITNPVGFGYAFSSGDVVIVNIPLPQPMRAVPSLPEGIVFTVKTVAGTSLSTSTYVVFKMAGNGLQVNLSGITVPAGQPCTVAATDFSLNLDL